MEDIIWDTITNKAKTRFDFEKFAKKFSELDENMADIILFQIIVGFASNEKEEIIAAKLFSNFLLTGFIWDKKEIDKFLSDKKDVLKIEIYVTQLANDLLRNGNDPVSVLNSVNQLLD